MKYIQGENRNQKIMFPDLLDDYIEDNNPVRVIDAYVNSINLKDLGFKYSESSTGRPSYNPTDMLKLYIYGYFNKIRSSRKLEAETRRNVELMWLLNKLSPDHKTISRFRKDNVTVLKNVFRNFVSLCLKLNLYGKELIAIDGSKFKAVNSIDNNFNEEKLNFRIKRIDEQLENYLSLLNKNDSVETNSSSYTKDEINQAIISLNEKKKKYTDMKFKLKETGETQISITDPDSKRMNTPNNTNGICYNIQSAVDDKNKLILDYEVTNLANDRNLLFFMAEKSKNILNLDNLTVVADKGYFTATDIAKCINNNITPHVSNKNGKVSMCILSDDNQNHIGQWQSFRGESVYIKERNLGVCSIGQLLFPRGYLKTENAAVFSNVKACKKCPYHDKCIKTFKRLKVKMPRESFSKKYDDRDLFLKQINYSSDQNILKKRKTIVEHPFGTIKRHLNSGYCLLKGLKNVQGEFALTFLVYNLKRAINILGVKSLIKEIISC